MTWHAPPPPVPAPAPPLDRRAYTSWTARVVASVIDMIPIAVGWGIWEAVAISSTAMNCVTFDNGGVACQATGGPAGDILFAVMAVFTACYLVWNFGRRQGATGSSIGKSAMRFRVVDQKTWRPVGFATSLLRQAVHVVDALVCFIGFLFPLWDGRMQTLADKLMGTVCVPSSPRRR